MALARTKTWLAGEVLFASDLNAEFNSILNNAISLISPLTAALDADGKEIILDGDGDTSITADTDDQIDFKVAGADDFQMTANKFDVLAGSTLKITGIETLTKGSDVASATDLLVGIDGNIFDVTGTTTIETIATKGVGTVIKLHFDAILTLTHHATNLILPGGANITTAAGDEAEFYEYASADWRCTAYTRASGGVILNADGGITLTDTDAGAGDGPLLILDRNSASPALADFMGKIIWRGRNDAAEAVDYADIRSPISDETDSTEDGALTFYTIKNGTSAERMRLDAGMRIGSPTDSDKGAGTLNAAGGLFHNGIVAVTAAKAPPEMSTGTDTDHDIDIVAGYCRADDAEAVIANGALTLAIDSTGNGGRLDADTLDADTWYNVMVGKETSGGTIVGGFKKTDAKPAAWDHYRRLGSVLTDASSNIIAFFQDGDRFRWDVPVSDYSTANPGTALITQALSVPTGIKVLSIARYAFRDITFSADGYLLVTSPDQTDTAPSSTLYTVGADHSGAGTAPTSDSAVVDIRTDTSAQVQFRLSASNADITVAVMTYGWIDPRGRNA